MTTVVFDLDDTLYKESDYLASGLRAVAADIAASCGADAAGLLGVMTAARDAFGAAGAYLSARGIEAPAIGRMLATYRSHRPDIVLPDDSRRTLDELRRRGCRLALITDGRSLGQRNKIEALGLGEYFAPEAIIISEEVGGEKTGDIPYLTLARRIGLPGPQCIFVGDNAAKDFRWGNLNGALTVMLRDSDGRNIHPQDLSAPIPAALRPRMVVDSLLRIPRLL